MCTTIYKPISTLSTTLKLTRRINVNQRAKQTNQALNKQQKHI